ncbi:MAG TPA: hypothetical protein DEG55_07615 [Acidaminococcaceae bacterium]|nr:hypothetical protein [Acidaminococcaceae bacterium]
MEYIDGLSAESMSDDQLAGLAVALGQLRDKQQKVLRMKYEQHMKNEEIGRITIYFFRARGRKRSKTEE